MPWWGIVILVFAGLELGYLFGYAVGIEDKYNKNENEEENDISKA